MKEGLEIPQEDTAGKQAVLSLASPWLAVQCVRVLILTPLICIPCSIYVVARAIIDGSWRASLFSVVLLVLSILAIAIILKNRKPNTVSRRRQ